MSSPGIEQILPHWNFSPPSYQLKGGNISKIADAVSLNRGMPTKKGISLLFTAQKHSDNCPYIRRKLTQLVYPDFSCTVGCTVGFEQSFWVGAVNEHANQYGYEIKAVTD
jgi:hypothetical protein